MKKLVFLLFSLCLFGCGGAEVKYIEKPVFLKCQVPEVPRAEIQPIPENATYPEKLKVILNNYFKLEKENELLRDALEVCK